MSNEKDNEILEELRKQTAFAKQSHKLNVISVIILAFFVLIAIAMPVFLQRFGTSCKSTAKRADTWEEARSLIDKEELNSALQMIQRKISKNPDYYFGYSLIGYVYHEMGDLQKTEENYAKAYALYPDDENEKKLKAIREAIRNKHK